jgi:peptide/nickel transport system substrate-binding protein
MKLLGKLTLGLLVGGAAVLLLTGFREGETARVDPTATLIVAIDQDIRDLDPRTNHAVLTVRPMYNVFEGLVTKTWHNGADALRVVPALATRWTISKNRRVYTFQLRRGVRFHDGTGFNAQAAVFHFRTLLDERFEFYYDKAGPFAKSRLPNVVSYAAPSPYVFRITLSAPDGGLLDTLATNHEFWMVSPTAVRTYGNAAIGTSRPVGTGPFRFTSYQPGQQLVLERNDSYWRGRAKFRRLFMRVMTDEAARVAALEGRSVHVAVNISVKNERRWAGRKDIKLVIRQQPTIKTCILDAQGGPGTKKLFRQALSLAANRQQMNLLVYAGKARASTGLFPRASPAFDPKLPSLSHNLTQARRLLSQAGVQNGQQLILETTTGDQNATDTWTVLQENLRQIGVNVQIKYVDGPTYVRDLTSPATMSSRGIDGFCASTMGTDTPTLLFDILGRRGFPPAGYNAYRYTNPAVEAAAVRARNAPSYEAWIRAMRDANRALARDYAGIFLIDDVQGFGLAGNVTWRPAAARAYVFYNAKVMH